MRPAYLGIAQCRVTVTVTCDEFTPFHLVAAAIMAAHSKLHRMLYTRLSDVAENNATMLEVYA